jgi:hypothetical protein
MKDVAGWSLVGLAALLGGYASYLFSRRVASDLADNLIDIFI